MRTPKPIQVHTLLNRLVALSQQSCKIIRTAHFAGQVNPFDKNAAESSYAIKEEQNGREIGYESVVTDVDLKCQHLISSNLKVMYPNATLIGEEDMTLETPHAQKLNLGSGSMLRTMLQADSQRFFDKQSVKALIQHRYEAYRNYDSELQRFSNKNKIFEDSTDFLNDTVDENEVCFWIDPLDGTGGFVKGHTEHVTCNIGVSVRGKPLFGVIGKPFPDKVNRPNLSLTFVGGITVGFHQVIHSDIRMIDEKFTMSSQAIYRTPFKHDDLMSGPVVCAARNRNQTQMDSILSHFSPTSIERVAGAGNKFVHLVTGKSDLYLNFVRGLKLWDTCAGDALIKARFGVMTNAHLENINYDHQNVDMTINDGIVACKSPTSLSQNLDRFEHSRRSSFEEAYESVSSLSI